jgi:hypothetical protein
MEKNYNINKNIKDLRFALVFINDQQKKTKGSYIIELSTNI